MNTQRVPVYCYHERPFNAPLALGDLVSFCQAYRGRKLTESFDFSPRLHASTQRLIREIRRSGPGVVLFSHYNWTARQCLAAAEAIKRAAPECITIHGGPSVPKYDYACDAYLSRFPQVDVAVRGEGELTLAELLECLAARPARQDWGDALRNVAGITFCPAPHDRSRTLRTAEREPIKDLDAIPSPYLNGFFDAGDVDWVFAILETNRGCPYGCAFCDWGSATLQKIRRFSLERVRDEIQWIGRHRVEAVFIADANFGIFERDIEIAEMLVRARQELGYPRQIALNYAKNATPRVAQVVRIFNRGGLTTEGIVSLQTTDADTLKVIQRDNIKPERLRELLEIFRSERMPISTDLIVGLPGATYASFRNDLQYCFDRRVHAKAYAAIVLPNSPMAHRDYMDEHGIEVNARDFVVATRTASRADLERMHALFDLYLVLVEFGALKYVLEFLQQDHGLPALGVLDRLLDELDAGSPQLRQLGRVRRALGDQNSARVGRLHYRPAAVFRPWPRVCREVAIYLERTYGIAPGSDLRAVLRVQQAVMPRFGRSYPQEIELEHDVVAWLKQPAPVQKRLREHGPGRLAISDPQSMCWLPLLKVLPCGHHKVHFELHSELMADVSRDKFFFMPEQRGPLRVLASILARQARISLKILRNALDGHSAVLGTIAERKPRLRKGP